MSKSQEIRKQFIDFFLSKGHTFVPSAPTIATNDPTLMFTNAGMNQFKDVFLEQGGRSYSRAVNSQKCIRVSGKHNDLEEVGPSPNHHTFFEMLGNWSFGDYYKEEAIKWAWELITEVWKIDRNRLFATIFEGDDQVPIDDEARQAWIKVAGIAPERIVPLSKKDNFWEMGEVGPCGPCSEIHYDFDPQPFTDGSAYFKERSAQGKIIELWNLVFIQFRRDETGALHPLPRKHVDTGAGLERISRVLEGVNSNYETSLFTPIIDKIVALSGVPYSAGLSGIPHRVIADHIRALSFSLADGVLPSNEGRGYVIRRILRRAARYGREIGLDQPFLYKLVEPLTEIMGDVFPEIKERNSHIVGVIKAEEESFFRTLGRGLEIFSDVTSQLAKTGGTTIPGESAFKLYDTFGFPLDLTQLMARERGLTVDTDRFDVLMQEQKVRARGEAKFAAGGTEFTAGLRTEFVGYNLRSQAVTVLAVNQSKAGMEIVLDRTPFYAEQGGQEADHGTITLSAGKFTVSSVLKAGDVTIHRGEWQGEQLPEVGDSGTAEIEWERRQPIQLNHTATHLLHKALKQHLGSHCNQAGSLVAPDRLRFDFTHFERVTPEMVQNIERTVNEAIRADYEVKWYEKPYKEALESGVTALFGEKYGDIVRVIQVGPDDGIYSRELCGGCHVCRTGELGLFRIVTEGSVSAGVRRIEAVTGAVALELALWEHRAVESLKDLVGSRGSDPVEKLVKTLEEKKETEKELERMIIEWSRGVALELANNAPLIGNVKVVTKLFDHLELDRLKLIAEALQKMNDRVVALLASPSDKGNGNLCCSVTDTVMAEGQLKAGALIALAAKVAGGGGGGKSHIASAGTKDPSLLPLAVDQFPTFVKQALGQ